MNANELNFAYKVRHALNENLDHLPASATERLAAARRLAVARKKKDSPLRVFAARRALAVQTGGFFHTSWSWVSRMGIALPIIVLIAGLIGIYQDEQQQRIADTAEIDAMVLADELPLSAYVDHGFNAYLAKRAD
jgi:hypothetical protein